MSLFVLVYGTLRYGMSNHFYMQGARFMESFRIKGFNMFKRPDDQYPYVKVGDGEIVVELYEISQKILDSLDVLEGYPDLYNRELVQVGNVSAWIYIFTEENQRSAIEISSGDWVDYFNSA